MDNLTLEVIFALIAILAVGAERLAELFGSALFASIEKYFGVKVAGKDVRTVVMVALVFVLNFAVMEGFDLDIVAKLLNENSNIVTIAMAAFMATGLSSYAHGLQKFFTGKDAKLLDILQNLLDAAKADQQPEE